jgi:ketopantoate reductase
LTQHRRQLHDPLLGERSTASSSRGSPIVTIQNGIRGAELAADALGSTHIWSGVTLMVANYLHPGSVQLLSRGWLMIGPSLGPVDRTTFALAAVLNDALPTNSTNNVTGAHWTKLIVNLNNALAH